MIERYPKYSVLMTVYRNDNPEWFSFAIDSMLNQTVKPDEFILVQDGPVPEALEKILNDYKKQYPQLFHVFKFSKNKTRGPALCLGVKKATNNLIAILDSDDYSVPNRIELELKLMKNDPEVGIVGSNIEEFENDPKNIISHVILPEKNEEIIKYSKKRCPFRQSSILFRKDLAIKSGNYRKYYLCEDYDLFTRMIKNNCKCYNIQTPLTYMRIDKNFYKRRGGIKYLKSILKFKKELLHTGYLTRWQYLKTATPHFFVCLMPNFLRDWVYRKLLRESR